MQNSKITFVIQTPTRFKEFLRESNDDNINLHSRPTMIYTKSMPYFSSVNVSQKIKKNEGKRKRKLK